MQKLLGFILLFVAAGPAAAYIGPGSGLSTIGAMLALVAGLVVAIFGFVWYPLKRIFRRKRGTDSENTPASERAAESRESRNSDS